HRHRRHQPLRGRGHAARHVDRRPHHGRAAERAQPPGDVFVLPADRDRGRDHHGRARGLDAQTVGQVRETMAKRKLAVVMAAALLAAGCGPRAEAPKTDAAPEAPRVALVLKTLNSPFFIDMEKGAQEAARRLGVNLTVQAAEREVDVDKQMQIIENLIQTGIKVLLVTPSGSKEIAPAIAKANKAGIRVVVVDTRVDAGAARDAGITIDSYIGSDNYEGGKRAGSYLVQATGGKANVGVLEGITGHETGDQRLRGFKDAVKDAKGIKIVA